MSIDTMNINISPSQLNKTPNQRYRGMGTVSANGSSRLLMDYKHNHPDAYHRILELLFGEDGLAFSHLKIEMGSDVNSSSGTEPCVMRNGENKADVTRGAGFMLAADAKKVNPDLTTDMLSWSEPSWVTASEDVYAARYSWYKENLCAAYEKYGLKFDFISLSRNERDIDENWLIYAAKRLKEEKDCPYDFSQIKTVASDEENAWQTAHKMADNEELRNLIDVIGSHYTSHSTDKAQLMSDKYGKELWFSEGCAPMTDLNAAKRYTGSYLAGANGILDIACRIASMYPLGKMTLYEFQPSAAAYYDGVCYCHKQLITCNEPWSGDFRLMGGYYMTWYFSQLFKKGWCFIDNGCFCDGEKDGHSLKNIKHCILTAADPATSDFSSVMVNPTNEEVSYSFTVSDMTDKDIAVWQSADSRPAVYKDMICAPAQSFTIKLPPLSITGITTLNLLQPPADRSASVVMPLPYKDDFSYSEEFLSERGHAPLYTTDAGGAFEVHGGRLVQLITPSLRAQEWGYTPEPVTSFGDDRWFNYGFRCKLHFSDNDEILPEDNYAGIGIRYNLGARGASGYFFKLYKNGGRQLMLNGKVLYENFDIKDFEVGGTHEAELCAVDNTIICKVDGNICCEYVTDKNESTASAGRAAYYSSWSNNSFSDAYIFPAADNYSAVRADDSEDCFEYSSGFEHNVMSTFANYRRTVSTGGAGEYLTFDFTGTGFALFGENKPEENGEPCTVRVELDGRVLYDILTVPCSEHRESFLLETGLNNGSHKARITVVTGKLNIDGGLII